MKRPALLMALLTNKQKENLNEISGLEKSSETYSVYYTDELIGKGGAFGYDSESKKFALGFGSDSKGKPDYLNIMHEMNHAFQYEKGEISMKVSGGFGSLYDIRDETNSYNQQNTLKGLYYYSQNNPKYTDKQVRLMTENGEAIYKNLRNGPIDINSKEGKTLRAQSVAAGQGLSPLNEIYKGWQKDYFSKFRIPSF